MDTRVDELLDVVLSTRKTVDPLKGKPFDAEAHHFPQRRQVGADLPDCWGAGGL